MRRGGTREAKLRGEGLHTVFLKKSDQPRKAVLHIKFLPKGVQPAKRANGLTDQPANGLNGLNGLNGQTG